METHLAPTSTPSPRGVVTLLEDTTPSKLCGRNKREESPAYRLKGSYVVQTNHSQRSPSHVPVKEVEGELGTPQRDVPMDSGGGLPTRNKEKCLDHAMLNEQQRQRSPNTELGVKGNFEALLTTDNCDSTGRLAQGSGSSKYLDREINAVHCIFSKKPICHVHSAENSRASVVKCDNQTTPSRELPFLCTVSRRTVSHEGFNIRDGCPTGGHHKLCSAIKGRQNRVAAHSVQRYVSHHAYPHPIPPKWSPNIPSPFKPSRTRIMGGPSQSHAQCQMSLPSTQHYWQSDRTTLRPTSRYPPSSLDLFGPEVLSERITEHEIMVPKKYIVEEIVEKTIVVPEKRIREELTEEVEKVCHKIIEIAKPVKVEKVVEVPEYEYVDKIIEEKEIIYRDKIKEVPKIVYEERVVEVPKIIQQERVVEVPQIEYVDCPVEKIVEVPEIREQVVIKEIPLPQYIEKPLPEIVNIEEREDVIRHFPVPLELVTTVEFKLPRLRQRWRNVTLPFYVPRFVEIAVPIDSMDCKTLQMAERYIERLSEITATSTVNVCDLEMLAKDLKDEDLYSVFQRIDVKSVIAHNAASSHRYNPLLRV